MPNLYVSDETMRDYVSFISFHIPKSCYASLKQYINDDFSTKNCYVPVDIITSQNPNLWRTIDVKIRALSYEKEFILYLSRLKGPMETLAKLQHKINNIVNDIIIENNISREKLSKRHFNAIQ